MRKRWRTYTSGPLGCPPAQALGVGTRQREMHYKELVLVKEHETNNRVFFGCFLQ